MTEPIPPSSRPADLRGLLLGRFLIVEPLGRGGMGEVYRARDESLGRDVAVKVLPNELTADRDRVARFVQEARAASALNHPHLTTVYEIGTDPVHYIAMELVRGRTLRAVLDAGRPELKHALDWLIQVCDALGAAHGAGVVHRDVKPENIMIADDGYAKVLDFGVAKLRPEAIADDETTAARLTGTGMMVGTSGYMSPEQARGLPTDHRTDIFAFGCILYECVTGTRAFDGASAIDRLHRVVHDEPAPLAARAAHVSPELANTTRKCLAKDPDDRYQSMKDLAVDLRYVRRQLETSSGDRPPAPVVRRRRSAALVMAILLTAAVSGLAVALLLRRSSSSPGMPAPAWSIDRLMTTGNTTHATLSPDGRLLAHVEALGADQTIWIRRLDTGEERQLVAAGNGAIFGLRFTPDNRSLAYTSRGLQHSDGRLNIMPVAGGTPRVIVSAILAPVTFSPDGTRLAFLREQTPDRESSSLIVANVDGSGEHILSTRRSPSSITPAYFTAPSWSPDGSRIAFTARNTDTERSQLLTVDVVTGAEQMLHESTLDTTFTHWLPDGSGIVYVSRGFSGYAAVAGQIWLKPYPSGEPRRITNDLIDYRSVSIAGDGQIAAVGSEYQASLYAVPLDGSAPRRLASNRYDGRQGIAAASDGTILTTTIVNGQTQIVSIAPDGTRTLLTTSGSNTKPAISADGSLVAMVSTRDGMSGVWRMNRDGSDQRLVRHLPSPGSPSFTPDGTYIVCTTYSGLTSTVVRLTLDGGEVTELARDLFLTSVSPDGRWLAGGYDPSARLPNARPYAVVMPLDGSAPVKPLGVLVPATETGMIDWAKDGSGLIASTSERFNLFFYAMDGSPQRQITNLADEMFISGTVAPDGKSVIAARGVNHRDVFSLRQTSAK